MNALIALVFLLGPGAAQAGVMRDPGNDSRATAILNLEVGSTLYDVAFSAPIEAVNFYGGLPGDFDFTDSNSAQAAVDAAVAELNLAGMVDTVGPAGLPDGPLTDAFSVGWSSEEGPPAKVLVIVGSSPESTTWANVGEEDHLYNTDMRVYARFTVVPEPGTALLLGLGLAGLGAASRSRRQATDETA